MAIDCGANVGDVTEALASRCRLVVAFEPNPVAFAALERRLGGRRNVRLVQAAVGADAGRTRLFDHVDAASDPLGASSGSSVHASKRNVDDRRWNEVDVVDLDAFIAQLGVHVDLLKLDVEGSEVEILERLVESGRITTIDAVVVEMHDGVIPALSARGATIRAVLDDPRYAHVRLHWR